MASSSLDDSGLETPTKPTFKKIPIEKKMIIHDDVHGTIAVNVLCRRIIDTPQFQRLREIKQLGCSKWVYPSATHSRYEHSIGVGHLAGRLYEAATRTRPDLYSSSDYLCVVIAGLIHDLGHGPLSHLWETLVAEADRGSTWTHEWSSLRMFDHLLEDNDIQLEDYLPLGSKVFIQELVYGPLDGGKNYKSREKSDWWMFDIINNKTNGADVDKMDYLARDGKACNIGISFDIERFLNQIQINGPDMQGRTFISWSCTGEENAASLFKDRSMMHRIVYQHTKVKVIERMVLDAMLEADVSLDLLPGQGKLTSYTQKPELLAILADDFLLRSIRISRNDALDKAKKIVNRIDKRLLYTIIKQKDFYEIPKKTEELQESFAEFLLADGSRLSKKNFAIVMKTINLGAGFPLGQIRFHDSRTGRTRTYGRKHFEKYGLQKDMKTVIIMSRQREDAAELEMAACKWMELLAMEEDWVAVDEENEDYHLEYTEIN